MNTVNLRRIFQLKFDYQTYCNDIVHSIFGCNDINKRPEQIKVTTEGDKCYFIGRMTDAEGRELGFFYTQMASGGDVRRKRVGLRKLIAPYVRYEVDAAIAIFDDGTRWRLSYICDMNEGATSPKRFSYVLGDADGQYNTPTHRLSDLSGKQRTLRIADIFDAFSVETLSKEFFETYHIHYDCIVSELARQGKTGTVYHDYVKKLMGRIVFLHFLQKKGWLCGDTNFMLNTFDKSKRQDDYLESVLEPLFFGILNTEPAKREQVFGRNSWPQQWVAQWADIPYLNGGLFERDAVDELRIVLPRYLFSDLFSFLASYNFTVDENDPDDAEIGVDPEMLGKIFESLLEDNKAKGAFYTPKEIVRYMCKESLIAHLASKLPNVADSVVRAFVEHHEMQPELEPYRDTLETALRDVKICDPAIGSGAFPMGLLNELWRCREALGTELSRLQLKKEIIENNIYGVDIERGAIDIARLRFWLSIVVDSETAEPLPNFDYKFMQGNSLIESYGGFDLSRIAGKTVGRPSTSTQLVIGLDSDLSRKNLQKLLHEYFSVTDHQKKATMRYAINAEVKTLIRESVGGTPTFLAKLEQLDPSANQDFFLWHTWFKDIFDKGGFDIVIGNPPYFKYEGANKGEIETIRKIQYLKNAFGGKLNAYKLFLALSINKICKNKGVISLIFQNSFIADKQATLLRKEVIDNHQIISIDSFPERDSKKKRVFENVKMSVCILLMQKGTTGKAFNVNFWNDKYKSSGTNIVYNASDIKSIDKVDYCIPRIEQRGLPLAIKLKQFDRLPLKCYEGELNMTFHKHYFNSNPINPTILKGAAIQRYFITREMSQGIIEYLDEKRFLAENFSDKAYHHEKERIAMQGMTGANDKIRLVMSMVPAGIYLSNSCNYIIPTNFLPAKYLLGILNSKLMNWFFRCFSTNSNVNGYEVENFPMPPKNLELQKSIEQLVDIVLRTKSENHACATTQLENEIDQKVYELYGLTDEEIRIIEG